MGRGLGPAELVSGGREGNVKVWDTRVASKLVVNMEPESSKRECWAVSAGNCYAQEERMVAAGYDNGDVKVWDLRKMALYWETNLPRLRQKLDRAQSGAADTVLKIESWSSQVQ